MSPRRIANISPTHAPLARGEHVKALHLQGDIQRGDSVTLFHSTLAGRQHIIDGQVKKAPDRDTVKALLNSFPNNIDLVHRLYALYFWGSPTEIAAVEAAIKRKNNSDCLDLLNAVSLERVNYIAQHVDTPDLRSVEKAQAFLHSLNTFLPSDDDHEWHVIPDQEKIELQLIISENRLETVIDINMAKSKISNYKRAEEDDCLGQDISRLNGGIRAFYSSSNSDLALQHIEFLEGSSAEFIDLFHTVFYLGDLHFAANFNPDDFFNALTMAKKRVCELNDIRTESLLPWHDDVIRHQLIACIATAQENRTLTDDELRNEHIVNAIAADQKKRNARDKLAACLELLEKACRTSRYATITKEANALSAWARAVSDDDNTNDTTLGFITEICHAASEYINCHFATTVSLATEVDISQARQAAQLLSEKYATHLNNPDLSIAVAVEHLLTLSDPTAVPPPYTFTSLDAALTQDTDVTGEGLEPSVIYLTQGSDWYGGDIDLHRRNAYNAVFAQKEFALLGTTPALFPNRSIVDGLVPETTSGVSHPDGLDDRAVLAACYLEEPHSTELPDPSQEYNPPSETSSASEEDKSQQMAAFIQPYKDAIASRRECYKNTARRIQNMANSRNFYQCQDTQQGAGRIRLEFYRFFFGPGCIQIKQGDAIEDEPIVYSGAYRFSKDGTVLAKTIWDASVGFPTYGLNDQHHLDTAIRHGKVALRYRIDSKNENALASIDSIEVDRDSSEKFKAALEIFLYFKEMYVKQFNDYCENDAQFGEIIAQREALVASFINAKKRVQKLHATTIGVGQQIDFSNKTYRDEVLAFCELDYYFKEDLQLADSAGMSAAFAQNYLKVRNQIKNNNPPAFNLDDHATRNAIRNQADLLLPVLAQLDAAIQKARTHNFILVADAAAELHAHFRQCVDSDHALTPAYAATIRQCSAETTAFLSRHFHDAGAFYDSTSSKPISQKFKAVAEDAQKLTDNYSPLFGSTIPEVAKTAGRVLVVVAAIAITIGVIAGCSFLLGPLGSAIGIGFAYLGIAFVAGALGVASAQGATAGVNTLWKRACSSPANKHQPLVHSIAQASNKVLPPVKSAANVAIEKRPSIDDEGYSSGASAGGGDKNSDNSSISSNISTGASTSSSDDDSNALVTQQQRRAVPQKGYQG